MKKRKIRKLNKKLKNIINDLDITAKDIYNEIESRPQYANIGKRGCLTRILKIIDKYKGIKL